MKQFISLLLLVSLLVSCRKKEDSCQPLGNTFTSVELDTSVAVGTLALHFTTLDTLPEAYYAEATLVRLDVDQNGIAFDNLAAGSMIKLANADSLKILLPPSSNSAKAVGVSIRYPDRQDFIDCAHPGSGDAYVLFLFFTYMPNGAIENFHWLEDYRRGGF